MHRCKPNGRHSAELFSRCGSWPPWLRTVWLQPCGCNRGNSECIRCASSKSKRAFEIWRYAATGQQLVRLLFLDSSTRHHQWQYRRAGFQGFLLCTWQGARAAQGESLRHSHAGAKDTKLMNEKLHEQLDLALDNLTEANEALHKARRHEQALKNQILE